MKLHYSTQSSTNSRYRKVKAVVNALKLEVGQAPHDANADLSTISVFNTLPILQTPHGSFFSSNTIIRYLANTAGGKLYGGENLHQKAQVDQWLDITTCDFQAAVAAVGIAKDGRQVDAVKILGDISKFLKFVEGHLAGRKFLVGDSASLADLSLASGLSVIFGVFGQQQRKPYPNLTAWYLSIVQTDAVLGGKDFPKESHKAFKAKKDKPKKQEKVAEKKQQKKEEDFDPFADEQPAKQEAPKPKKQAKKQKPKPIAKSIVVFDVKIYEQGFDLDGLWQKIKKQVILDGLVFNNQPKKIHVIGEIYKLQIGCVIEDAKVNTDDIFDKILAWEDDVQSIDIVSFQKL